MMPMPYRYLLISRYSLVLEGLQEAWPWKGLIAVLMALFATPVQLIVLICFLIFADFFAGLYNAVKTGRKVRALKMRQTVTKSLEYTAILLVFTGISNSFDLLSWMQSTAFAFVALTEAKSIFENLLLKGSRTELIVKKMFQRAKQDGIDVDGDPPNIDEGTLQ